MTTERPTFGQAYSHGNVDSLFQAETYADELKQGYQATIENAVWEAEATVDSQPGAAYKRGCELAVAAIKALSQEGA